MMKAHDEKWIPTDDFAALFAVKGSTVRRSLCVKGHYLGVIPNKLPNNRLLWPESAAHKLLNREQGGAQ